MTEIINGLWIPPQIWENTELELTEKVVLTVMHCFVDSELRCNLSNGTLSKLCQCSEKTISRSIAKLVEKGFIKIVSFDGRKRVIDCTSFFSASEVIY